MPGMKGFDSPPTQMHYDEMPALDGGYLRHIRRQSRELFIPLFFHAPDRQRLLKLKREFLVSLSLTHGAGQIRITEGDGSSRYINVYYASGAEGDQGKDQAGFAWLKYGLILRALDPYWYAGDAQVIEFTPGALNLKRFFDGPFLGEFPLNSSHTLNGASEITITGDVDTWPIWYVHGPGSNIKFTRRVTNKPDQVLSVNTSLSATDLLVVDTRPGFKSVVNKTTEENLWRLLGPSPQLWPIAPGRNEVEVGIDGVGAETAVILNYTPRFLSA